MRVAKEKRLRRKARKARQRARWRVAFEHGVDLMEETYGPSFVDMLHFTDSETLRILTAQEAKARFKQGSLLCGACSEGRLADCSGWCANYHAGVTE